MMGSPAMAVNRWYMPGPLGEETMPTDLPQPAEPSFEGRFIYGGEWGEKNGQGGLRAITGHTWHNIVPPDKYWDTHPEYYSLNDGKRTRIAYGEGQLCTTNPDVIRIFADYCIEFFHTHPNTKALDVGANDCVDWCECENCLGLGLDRHRASGPLVELLGVGNRVHDPILDHIVTDRIVMFYNQVAQLLYAAGYGDRKLVFLAYNNMTEPPVIVKPDVMLVPQICRWIGYESYGEGIEADPKLKAVFEGWAKVSPTIATWDYWGSWQWPWFFPNVTSIGKDMKFYKKIGVDVVYSDTAACWATQGLNIWLAAQLSRNVDQDVDTLIKDYCEGMFHKAAPEMLRFYKVLEDSTDKLPSSHTRDEGAAGFFTPELFFELGEALIDARMLAKDDDKVWARLDIISDGLAYTEHYMSAYKWSKDVRDAAQALLIALKQQKQGYFSDLSVIYAQNLVAHLLYNKEE